MWWLARTVTIDELLEEEGYDAVYIGTGAGLPQFMNVPGEHLNGVYSANEFLTRINLMKAYKFPVYDEPMLDLHGKHVAVIGGGNTALDAIRSALRLGAEKAYVIYRRSDAEMPARAEEVHHARQEGIDFQMLTAPVEFLSDGKGWLTGARCVRMELGEPDASGRRRPVPKEGSEFELPLSVAVIAIGTSANPIVQSTTPGLGTNKRGYIQASERDAANDAQSCVCRWGHRDRRRDGDSRDGCWTPCSELDSRVSDDRRLVIAKPSSVLVEIGSFSNGNGRRRSDRYRLRAMNRSRM